MWTRANAALIGLALGTLGPNCGALAEPLKLPCDGFVKNDDATWSALRSVPIRGVGESFTVREGSVLRAGAAIRGVDLAGMLDEQCPATPEPPSQPATLQPAAPPPRVTLGSFVNGSGAVETQRLSCAEIADASAEEARLFLAWHSGWYSGLAKRRGMNLARTSAAIASVIQYCQGNRSKTLAAVMDLMLK